MVLSVSPAVITAWTRDLVTHLSPRLDVGLSTTLNYEPDGLCSMLSVLMVCLAL